MGIVYAAYDATRDMRVALKTLCNLDPVELYRFKREFRALRDLSHPNVIALYELVSEFGAWYLTMEIVDGVHFTDYVWRAPALQMTTPHVVPLGVKGADEELGPTLVFSTTDTPTPDTAITPVAATKSDPPACGTRYGGNSRAVPPLERQHVEQHLDIARLYRALTQLSSALIALHSMDIIHRDLKPSNVLVTQEGRLVLMDFGIVAEMRHRADRQLESMISGTPAYMAPEQARGTAPRAAADWYAAGVMLFQALTQTLPFLGTHQQVLWDKQRFDPFPVSAYVDGVPDDLAQLCAALLGRDPDRRPTGAEVLAALATRPSVMAPISLTGSFSNEVFVGRTKEIATLRRAHQAACAGSHSFVAVTGPSGIGKSAMLERFVSELRASERSGLVLYGRCHERETLPFKALDSIIDELSTFLLDLPTSDRAEMLPPGVAALTQLFPTLSRVPECKESQDFGGRNPLEVRRLAIDVLRSLISTLGQTGPVVLCIEDLQWADRDSLELLHELLRQPVPQRLLVVLTVRTHNEDIASEERLTALLTTLADHNGLVGIDLGPLPQHEQRELVRRLTATSRNLDEDDTSIWKEAGGHPMLLAELAHFAQGSSTSLASGRLNLKEVIWHRIRELPDTPQKLLLSIAVAGIPLPLWLLGEACDLADAERERAWTLLRLNRLARRVSRADDQHWTVAYHDKVRETIVAHLADDELASLHGRLAQAMEGWEGASAASLAHHWLAARDRDRGVRYLVEAARSSARQLALDRAAELYRSALENMPESSDDPALESLRCRALVGLAEGLRLTEQVDEALQLLALAEPVASEHELTQELATLHFLRGNLLFPTGQTEACLAEHQLACSFARAARSLEHEARALGGIGDAYLMRGRMLMAFEHYNRCVQLCRQNGLTGIEVANLPQRAWTGMYRNCLAESLQDARDAIVGAARIGHQRAEVFAHAHLGMILTEMACVDEACEVLQKAVELPRRLGMARFVLSHTPLLAKAMALQGNRKEAEAMLSRALERSQESDLVFCGPLQLGVLALAADDPVVIRDALQRGEELLLAGALGYSGFFFYRDAMEASFRLGDVELLCHHATGLERFTREEPMPWSHFFICWGRALAKHLRDPSDPAIVAEMLSLRDEATTVGLHLAAGVLSRAIEPNEGFDGTE